MPTSYNGWPASQDPKAIGIDRTWEPLPGIRFPGGIKAGPVATVMAELVRRLDAEVEPAELYTAGDEWGYHYKQSANSPSLLSCHSSGTAIDYNATRHPNRVRGTFTAAQVATIRRIVSELEVIRWLGDTTGTPDEMHFEIKGSPTRVAAVAARLEANPTTPTTPAPEPTPPPAPPAEEDPMNLPAFIVKSDDPADPRWYVTDTVTRQWVQNRAHAALLISQGAAKAQTGTGDQARTAEIVPFTWPGTAVASIRLVE